jgi:hypothetical protein
MLGEGFRVISPSRFGYFGSTHQPTATPADQADTYAILLDHLGIDRAADLLNAGRSPGSAAVGFQGAGRSLHKRRCHSGLSWLENGCAVLPAPDREWLHRGLSQPKVGLPSRCLLPAPRERRPHAGDDRRRPAQGLPHRRRAG